MNVFLRFISVGQHQNRCTTKTKNRGQIFLYGSSLVNGSTRRDEGTSDPWIQIIARNGLRKHDAVFVRCTSTSRKICVGSGCTRRKASTQTTAPVTVLWCGELRNRTTTLPLCLCTTKSTQMPQGTPAACLRLTSHWSCSTSRMVNQKLMNCQTWRSASVHVCEPALRPLTYYWASLVKRLYRIPDLWYQVLNPFLTFSRNLQSSILNSILKYDRRNLFNSISSGTYVHSVDYKQRAKHNKVQISHDIFAPGNRFNKLVCCGSWTKAKTQNTIAGFHMTSLKFELQIYWSSWDFT